MSAGPQISWDEPQAAAPPQIQWDDEKPKLPGARPFLTQALETGKVKGPAVATQPTQFEKEHSPKPEDTGFWGRARQYAGDLLGMGKGFAQSVPGARTVGDIAEGNWKDLLLDVLPGSDLARSAVSAARSDLERQKEGRSRPYRLIAGGAQASGIADPTAMEESARRGDPTGVLTHAAAQATPIVAAEAARIPAVERASAAINRATVSPITRLATQAIERFRAPEAQAALTQAIQPGVRVPKAQESIAIAGPRIQQIRQATGVEIPAKGPEALKSVLDLNRQAKTQILSAIEDRMGPVADLRPTTKTVADAIRNSVDEITLERSPGARAAVERAAQTYEREGVDAWTLRQMEERMHTLNNHLGRFYSQPTAGEGAIPIDAEMSLAEAGELRKVIDRSVERLSGEGVKGLKREYGAQRDVEKGLARQYAVATRTKAAPLWEGLAYLQAAGDLVSGGVWGAAKAAAKIAVGNRLQLLRDSGYLANQAFHGPRAFQPAEPIAPHGGPPAPAGLLPSPATEAGFNQPDTSGTNRGQSGRWTTPAALVPEQAQTPTIPAKFLREIPQAAREAVKPKGLLPSGELPRTTEPPGVEEKFATEGTGRVADETKLGPRGQGGIRIPIKGMLPAAREAMGTPPPPAPKPKYTPSEKAATMSAPAKDYGPEFNAQQAQEEINRNQAILRNPKATEEERAIAADRLRDAKEPSFGATALKAAKEAEPVEVKIKGITAEEPKPVRPKRDVMPPVESRYSPEEIAEGEGLLAQEAGAMATADRPGVYFDENPENQFTPQRQQSAAKGITSGGSWRGVKSGREMYPFMREHPELNPEAVLKALRNKDSAFYKRAMEAAIEFVNRGKDVEAEERAAIAEEPPEEKTPEGVLPGFGPAVKAQEEGAGRVKAEELTRELNTPRDINAAAGEMETKSPLFRGTEASPQNEMFGRAGRQPETYWKGDKAVYTGNTKEIAGGLFYELKLTEGHLKGESKWTQTPPPS